MLTNEFRLSSESGAPTFRLISRIPNPNDPVQTVADWDIQLQSIYEQRFPSLLWDFYAFGDRAYITNTNQFHTKLRVAVGANFNSIFVYREGNATNGMSIRSEYYWDGLPESEMAGDGYTSPLIQWKQSTVTGLTTNPIVLRSPWAQSYKCKRKNFWEEFYLEPELDPDLPAETKAELRAKNIRIIAYMSRTFVIFGFDGAATQMPGDMVGQPNFGF
jgi:hypothetical protein